MKHSQIIRFLSGLSFLIFFCPFFQMCSDESMLIKIPVEVATSEEGMNTEEIEKMQATYAKKQKLAEMEAREQAKKKYTKNAYELAIFPFINIEQITLEDILDKTFYPLLSYTLLVMLSLPLLIYTLKKKYKKVIIFSTIVFALALFPLVFFYTDNLLEDINQIKYGYYLFLINIFAIIYFSLKAANNATI